ncbi:hypothetical protein Athai_52910 [Actinocatenispora thailandica]|uniref:DUF1023 domain-containing protein n=1 Tax=Actinocatenispora thailandica TaxID=227318 RepID=A0A7R7HZ34_9ACTN|nr:alpha/beta hydrolase [Actinocatenispora thailandica]BCJ37788.1 hypothetical protein Athai_52910 [Actinocatenispora thailandica]
MLTVEQLRQVRPGRVAAVADTLRADAARMASVVEQAVESAGKDLASWHGPAATASTAHRHALVDDARRLGEARTQAATVIADVAERLDEATQLLSLADSFAGLVGCRVHGRAEVTVLPSTMLGPLANVYDSVRRTAASLAARALVVAEAADLHASRALGAAPGELADPDPGDEPPAAPGPPAGAGEHGGGSELASAGEDPREPTDRADQQDDADRLDQLSGQHSSVGDLAPAVMLLYAGMSASRRRAARRKRPGLVAGLPGAPLPERYAASRQLIDESRAELRRSRSALAAADDDGERSVARARTTDAINQRIGTLNSFLAARTVSGVDPATGGRVTDRYERSFLGFDPSGAGRVAEVFGDLARARNVAVLVPGGRNGLDTFNSLAADARLLADTAGPGTAVVVWLGYDSAGAAGPGGVPARARSGATALRRFVAGIAPNLRPDARTVLLGHGFGTVLVAAALRAGYQPDDAVFVGSAGLGERIRSAADLRPATPNGRDDLPGPVLRARTGTRWWAVRAPGDTLAYSRVHGADPADFADVTRLETQGGTEVVGHDRYYAIGSESLDNLARVVAGRLTEVTCTDTTLEEELLLAGLDRPAPVHPPGQAPVDGVLGSLDGVLTRPPADRASTPAASAPGQPTAAVQSPRPGAGG